MGNGGRPNVINNTITSLTNELLQRYSSQKSPFVRIPANNPGEQADDEVLP